MSLNFLKKTIHDDFVVIDAQFPQEKPFGFRNSEINEYIKRIPNFHSYTMHVTKPDNEASYVATYGMSADEFLKNKIGYLSHYPLNEQSVKYLEKDRRYSFKLAYSFFLAQTYVLLPFLERNKIPFIFVLYPGGLFSLLSKESDFMLRKVCSSKYFKRVIVTQHITKKHLLDNKICDEDQIDYIYGGFAQFSKSDIKSKKYYKKDKSTFDICFVAGKNIEGGIDKGYDLFIEAAKIICKTTQDINFHVIGNFDENDLDVTDIKERIRFYGLRDPDFLIDFYSGMDIFMSPNRPYKLYEGNFDGFPLGLDAGFCGTAMFVADELKMNDHFKDMEDIVIIPTDAEKIAKITVRYYNDIDALYALSELCKKRSQELFSLDYQISERIRVINKEILI